jgi:hypothetical protein
VSLCGQVSSYPHPASASCIKGPGAHDAAPAHLFTAGEVIFKAVPILVLILPLSAYGLVREWVTACKMFRHRAVSNYINLSWNFKVRISAITLDDFKRFTRLTITGLGPDVRLVMLAGPNGSGKSSLFDALMLWRRSRRGGWNDDNSYYRKGIGIPLSNPQRVTVHFYGPEPTGDGVATAFYFRTAYRNEPSFAMTTLQQQGSILDERRFDRMIEPDATVSSNYGRLASQALEDAFATYSEAMTLREFREQVIGEIRTSVQRIFPELVLNRLGNPFENGTFRFDKGTVHSFDSPFQVRSATVQHRQHGGVNGRGKGRGQGL